MSLIPGSRKCVFVSRSRPIGFGVLVSHRDMTSKVYCSQKYEPGNCRFLLLRYTAVDFKGDWLSARAGVKLHNTG